MADRYRNRRPYGETTMRDRDYRDEGTYGNDRNYDYESRDRYNRGDRDRYDEPWNGVGRGPRDAHRYGVDYEDRDYRPAGRDERYEGGRYTPSAGYSDRRSGWGDNERYSGGSYSGASYGGGYGGGDYGGYGADYAASGRGFRSFTGDDVGGADFVAGGARPYGGYGRGIGSYSAGGGYGPAPHRGYTDRNEDRGFVERAGDKVESWFDDDDDYSRRRQSGYAGHGPANYSRSDDRVLEDASDRLTDDWRVDARNVEVTVNDGEITLNGTVRSREQKHRAERCVESLSGVRHVQNNLRVQEYDDLGTSDERVVTTEKTTGVLT
ncbi:BON domain-containing protein [Altericroceibacterium xinjiangense]|uniref:BON domain-containing protein n=1 Tax=Altericroceibacterium xinjiangense TaxID=762261 RepID=UPI000F7EEC4F|nr:BON domain-containing protein [Altericroceibacterium xinjiangense]